MTNSAKLVVIMGTQYYDGTGLGASDYPVTDLLQMLGRASRPGKDEVCVLTTRICTGLQRQALCCAGVGVGSLCLLLFCADAFMMSTFITSGNLQSA
jgi:hypothetical protein